MAVLLDLLFRQITTFISVCLAYVFGLQALSSMDFSKFYQLKGLQPKNKAHLNFYESCVELIQHHKNGIPRCDGNDWCIVIADIQVSIVIIFGRSSIVRNVQK